MSDILKQIDQLVADKTFSLDALDGIKAIRDALIKAEHNNELLTNQNVEQRKQINDLERRLEQAETMSASLNIRLGEMELTIKSAEEAIYNAKKHEAVASAWREAMQTVFKPNVVRESVSRSIPVAVQSGPSSSYVQNYNDSSTVVREEG